jgi:hypothetical protein
MPGYLPKTNSHHPPLLRFKSNYYPYKTKSELFRQILLDVIHSRFSLVVDMHVPLKEKRPPLINSFARTLHLVWSPNYAGARMNEISKVATSARAASRCNIARVLPLIYLSILCLALLSSYTSAVVAPQDRDRVQFLLAQIAQAKSQIHTVTFKCHDLTKQATPDTGLVNFDAIWTVAQKDDCRASDVVTSVAFTRGQKPQHQHVRGVINDDYSASCWMSNNNPGPISQFMHASIATQSEQEASAMGSTNLNILRLAFGDGNLFVTDFHIIDMPNYAWSVVEEMAGGKHLFHLRAITVKDQTLDTDWSFDADRNFTVVSLSRYDAGKKMYQLSVDSKRLDNGYWLPAHVNEKFWTNAATLEQLKSAGLASIQDPVTETDMEFTAINVNQELNDEQFTISFLDPKNGTPIQRTEKDGASHKLVFDRGTILSEPVAKAGPGD